MIFKVTALIIVSFSCLFSIVKPLNAEEKFEALIASVNSEAITTYDLSQRIKLVLKSLKLNDNIKNRDSVRDRVLELLIIEKLKKIEAQKAQVDAEKSEVIEFASVVYNFPIEEFNDFKSFLEDENIDFSIVLEQLKTELIWKKFSQQRFSSKITINSVDIDAIINNYKNKFGKVEYNYSEILLLNDSSNNWQSSKKKMDIVLSLLDSGTSFDMLANKFSDTSPQGNNNKASGWILEDNIDKETRSILEQMKIGEIKKNIRINNGYKIIKLNKKKRFGDEQVKFSFLKFSSFDEMKIMSIKGIKIGCNKFDEKGLSKDIKYLKIQDILAKDLSEDFLYQIKNTEENNFTSAFEVSGEYNILYICEKNVSEIKAIPRDMVERQAFSKKFNQLSNTYISNIRKSANIKFFNK